MNFRIIFNAFITVVMALLLMLVGFLVFLLPWAPSIRETLIHFIEQNTWPWNLFGFGLMLIGSGLIVYIRSLRGKKFYTFNLGDLHLEVSENVIKSTLESYWKSLFPNADVPFKVWLGKKKIEIQAELPKTPIDEQKPLLEKIDQDLKTLLRDRLALTQRVQLELSFE